MKLLRKFNDKIILKSITKRGDTIKLITDKGNILIKIDTISSIYRARVFTNIESVKLEKPMTEEDWKRVKKEDMAMDCLEGEGEG